MDGNAGEFKSQSVSHANACGGQRRFSDKKLTDTQRFKAWQMFDEGASTMEIASAMNTTEANVYNAISKARDRFYDLGALPTNKKTPAKRG